MKRNIYLKAVTLVFTILLIFDVSTALSQDTLTQTVRGSIKDADLKIPLIGAAIVVDGIEPLLGTTADVNGNFRLERVPVGRFNFVISYVGYEPQILSEILVGTGKEVVLEIELKETSHSLGEVVVWGSISKDRPRNSMATVSARTFSVEEASRYAGGLDDPARLAAGFAGVATTQTTNNAIIIRGNSPRGVLWRVEGVDVPATFHFPNVDFVGGGGYTVFSSQMLRNSDFFTGAFPAEYGNAFSGVFDVKMRTGNVEKREYTAGVGIQGLDFAAEGPFIRGERSTYLFNYRYGTLGLIGKMVSFPNLPTFQDVTFKFDFPTRNSGTFTIWGMGADDINNKDAKDDPSKWETSIDYMSQRYKNRFGVVGLSHQTFVGRTSYLETMLSADGMRNTYDKREYSLGMQMLPVLNSQSTEGKYTFRTVLNHRFNTKINSRTGITVNSLFFDNKIQMAFYDHPENMMNFVDTKGRALSTQIFTQFRIDLLPNVTANLGVHSMYLDVNGKATFEPRVGINWEISQNDELSIAYGMHSQMEELRTYFSEVKSNGIAELQNKNLDFMKSHHFVLGYSRRISDVIRMKIEPYYQRLEDIPVYPNSSFSIINVTSNWAINRKLENSGTGKNYGIDVTLERFIKNGYYYLFTATLFDSKYTGGDGKEYNTVYNRGHVINLMAGKEWMLKNKNILGISAKITRMGGLRYTPVLYEESMAASWAIPDHSRAYESQFPSTTGVDLSITYKVNKSKSSGTWYFMIKNALIQPDYSDPFYSRMENEVIIDTMKMPFPSLGYKIEF
ncbi:MAG: TonB-dependent receptor [Balneolaceae bacterium]|nr:MAG: TonB-dependent receptor [Balneolaceae bacterium]